MLRIGILAALPREVKPLVRGWTRVDAPKYVSLWTHQDAAGDQVVAACAGMGANAARRAFGAVEAIGPLDLVLSVGLAGATGKDPKLQQIGQVGCASEVIDVQTGERFLLSPGHRALRLATVTQAAGAAEKARLAATYGAALVDMEAATVARLATMRGVPMMCVKAVSDVADTQLPEIDAYVDAEGQLQVPRFALHLMTHPASWGPVAALAKASRLASVALCVALTQFLHHKDWEHTNRTGGFAKPHQDEQT